AAAFAAVVLAGGLYYELAQRRDTFGITIYLVSAENPQNTVRADGTITLRTNPPRQGEFQKGIAEFRELPRTVSGQEVDYSIDVKGYVLAPDALKKVQLKPGGTVELLVRAIAVTTGKKTEKLMELADIHLKEKRSRTSNVSFPVVDVQLRNP